MRTKRYIALLLTVVYLFAVGAPASAALACRCVQPHVCCFHCDHTNAPCDASGASWTAPCCGDSHSTEVALYTSQAQDDNRTAKRIAVVELPPSLAAESPHTVPLPAALSCDCVTVWNADAVPAAFVAANGLRAPPVLV